MPGIGLGISLALTGGGGAGAPAAAFSEFISVPITGSGGVNKTLTVHSRVADGSEAASYDFAGNNCGRICRFSNASLGNYAISDLYDGTASFVMPTATTVAADAMSFVLCLGMGRDWEREPFYFTTAAPGDSVERFGGTVLLPSGQVLAGDTQATAIAGHTYSTLHTVPGPTGTTACSHRENAAGGRVLRIILEENGGAVTWGSVGACALNTSTILMPAGVSVGDLLLAFSIAND